MAEAICIVCEEEWPATREFFYPEQKGTKSGLKPCCIACWREHRATVERRIYPPSAKPRQSDVIAPLLTTPTFFGANIT